MTEPSWVPDTCTLPSPEQPLRVAEFTEIFTRALQAMARPEPSRLRLSFEYSAEVETTAGDLTARESACCSFFDFTITHRETDDLLVLDIGVAAGHEPVLDSLADQAAAAAPTAQRD